ncbi:hypothetical protein [Erythrobacter crassostreae]|uniref:Uncharacterized protein n=1 Tax=Erythrobacter crassostreae TaxID=2828328 RepID=A0A9X1F4G5_9SPHN|nr:hypothetical protein [Erythrobacter crassostrea]MBV7260067.1 hypothetical protein [Erythrobacter crassostrea]
MIEIVPVMLFILGWHPDKPGDIDLQRVEVIFASPAECEAAGSKMASRMTQAAAEQSGATYEHRCMEIPAVEEFEAAFGGERSPAK